MESSELKKIDIKNRTCYYFDYIIKTEDFDFDNVLIHAKSDKIFCFMQFHTKLCLVQSHCPLDMMK